MSEQEFQPITTQEEFNDAIKVRINREKKKTEQARAELEQAKQDLRLRGAETEPMWETFYRVSERQSQEWQFYALTYAAMLGLFKDIVPPERMQEMREHGEKVATDIMKTGEIAGVQINE